MSLAKRLLKSLSKGTNAAVLSDSDFKIKKPVFKTNISVINAMLSGDIDGGVMSGITQLVGDSRCFKSGFCLANVKSFLDEKPEGVCIFFDSEFGSGGLFESYGIDQDRVIHIPFSTVEELKIEISKILDETTPEDDVIIYIDSISQVASKKETEDALEGKVVADMTRAKAINSLFRIITPVLTLKDIPLFVINSFYADTSSPYAENIIKGGKQAFLSSDTILFVTRSQDKDAEGLQGWNFNYTAMKSRYVKEKSKFSLNVRYDQGINENSGLFDWAVECGIVYSEKQGFFKLNLSGWDGEKSWRRAALESDPAFFNDLRKNKTLKEFVKNKYQLESKPLLAGETEEVIDDETGEVLLME